MLETTSLKLLIEAAKRPKGTSTVQLADVIDVSQQSVSRVLTELEKEVLIIRRQLATGLTLELTGKGRLALLALQGKLDKALNETKRRKLHGTLEQGIGEGKYYVSLSAYMEPLKRLLGGEPFPGTLNLRVRPEERALFLATLPSTEIPGFTTKDRTYGAVKFYSVIVGDRKCGLLLPIRSTYGPEKVELVDTVEMRKEMQLEDGDEIVVEERR